MKKQFRKWLSRIFPKGNLKEHLKMFFYNCLKPEGASFEIVNQPDGHVYKTNFKGSTLMTNEALYRIAPDFQYYQHFYNVKKGDVVIDAGANCGHLSVFFSKAVGPDGVVYAFEPDRFNIERIKKNMALNAIANNIVIEDSLLWDKNENIEFYEAGTRGSSAVWKPENVNLVSKAAVTIDSWVKSRNLQRLDFIKMDIEGAEIEALDGCVETIKTLAPNFAIASYHIVNGEPTYIKVEQFFKKYNYPYRTITLKKNEIITFAGFSVENS